MIYNIRKFFWNLWWVKIKGHKHLKESMFGSMEKVKEINKCPHQWKPVKGIIFEYILVDARCEKCGTSRGI